MERYNIIKEVGNGTFGSVWRAINKQSGEVVAIKKMKRRYYSWEECMSLREVKECNLYQLMKDRGNLFSEVDIRNWCSQVFQENLLVSKDIIKIADFGLAREINSRPPFTEYVSTRWYRAPEVLLQSPAYGPPVDMWAMGAIMAELFSLRPLFPGSSEANEIYKICCILGSPTKREWSAGLELASAINYQFPQVPSVHLSLLIPGASEDAINLITSLCSWDPYKRPTAVEALQHPFFQSCFYVPPSLRHKAAASTGTPPYAVTGRTWEQNCGQRGPASLSDLKPTKNFYYPKSQPNMTTNGVPRKLDMNKEGVPKRDKTLKLFAKQQPRYHPPGMNGPSSNWGRSSGESDTAENFSNMTVSSGAPLAKRYVPPPMKAGGWHGPSQVVPGRPCIRKVAG